MIRSIKVFLLLTMLSGMVLQGCVVSEDDQVNPSDPREKFLGDWKVDESCSRMNYTVSISADPGNSSQVLIDNFGNPGPDYDPAVGLIVSNTIKVSSQNIGEGWTVSGNGTFQSNGTILWTYSLIISGVKENCNAVFSP